MKIVNRYIFTGMYQLERGERKGNMRLSEMYKLYTCYRHCTLQVYYVLVGGMLCEQYSRVYYSTCRPVLSGKVG